jgi:hypothetical protein
MSLPVCAVCSCKVLCCELLTFAFVLRASLKDCRVGYLELFASDPAFHSEYTTGRSVRAD